MYGKMQEFRLTEIIPLICTSALWGQYPVFSHPESPQGAPSAVVADGCNILCLLTWQAAFLVHTIPHPSLHLSIYLSVYPLI